MRDPTLSASFGQRSVNLINSTGCQVHDSLKPICGPARLRPSYNLAIGKRGSQSTVVSFLIRDAAVRSARDLAAGVLFALLACQPLAAGAAPEPQPYRIDEWQVDQGLPQSSVTSIVQTRDGYLWLGTFSGLVRFDGTRFKVFTPDNAPGLTSSRIIQIFEDRQGALWIGTEEGDVVRCADGRFQAYAPPSPGKYISAFAETVEGVLLMVSSGQELFRFAAGRFTLVSTNWDLLGTKVNGLMADPQGQVMVSTEHEIGVWLDGRFNEAWEQNRQENFGPGALAGSRDGGCWVAANGRLRRFNHGQWVADYGAYPWSKGDLYCMLEDHNGRLWIGTYGSGLFRYETNGTVLHISTKEGLSGDFVRSLCEDREGNLWVGTESHGLARLTPTVFRSYGRQQGLSGDNVLTVCEGEDGELWIGMNGDGVDRLKDGMVRHYGPKEGLTNECVWSVLQDSNKTFWAGTWGGGLFRLEGEGLVPVPEAGEENPVVCAMYEDSKGALWLGQHRSKPEIINLRQGKATAFILPAQHPNLDVRTMLEDREGNLWIGTQGDGLYRIKDGECVRFGKRDGLGSESIRTLYADNDGALWIGTYGGGLNRLEGGEFTTFTTKEGLVNDAICYVTEDKRGNLWCSSGSGVFRVSKEELNRFARGQARSIRCFAYTKADGLPSLECSGGSQPAGCKTRDGRLWFPTVRGLAVVDPENVPINLTAPPVVIEEVVLEGKPPSGKSNAGSTQAGVQIFAIAPRQPATLKVSPGNQRLEFHYTGLSFTAPEKVQFKYKLEGLEEEWVDAGTRRAANYSHLPPGNYRFCVRACNNDGIWNEAGATLALTILPYFWQSWWFRLLGATAVVLLFVLAYEIRLASERKLVRLRLRIARDLHDEVGSNLGSIALLSEVMPRPATGPAEEVSEIRRIAIQTIGSLRDIVWFLDPASDSMGDLIIRMKETARTMLPGIAFEFRSAGRDGSRTSLELRRNVFLMFKEILHNIAKHAHATRVEIEVEVTPRQFRLRVSDNGIGFEETRVHSGNGLKNLRRRAADLRGSMNLESRTGHGTIVTLTAPVP
jgi:ligand-binding sensor domain-containing protein